MPMIRVSMFPGRTPDQKAELVSRLTDTFLEVCGRPGQSRDGVWVMLEEVPPAHWGTGGHVGPPDDPAVDRAGDQAEDGVRDGAGDGAHSRG